MDHSGNRRPKCAVIYLDHSMLPKVLLVKEFVELVWEILSDAIL
jgi:hypothetical protein